MKVIKKDPTKEHSDWYEKIVTYTPVYWVDEDGNEHFVQNEISYTGNSFDDKESKEKTKKMIEILKENNFRFMPSYLKSWFTRFPVEDAERFLEWKNKNGYTFDSRMTVQYLNDDGSNDFIVSGNLNEYSAAFHFSIYDSMLIKVWKSELKKDGIKIEEL